MLLKRNQLPGATTAAHGASRTMEPPAKKATRSEVESSVQVPTTCRNRTFATKQQRLSDLN